ncbi:MAG: carbon-nitrogen family hydrolase [Deltaproteobacteria bacterium]|nr:carbon-nitrogen family hydrolase [Deltaproteobacteria bacterium]
MRIVSIQLGVTDGAKDKNLERTQDKLNGLKDVDLIILPELWNIGFMNFDQYMSDAEGKDGPILAMLRNAARKIPSYIHTGSFVEKEGDRYYNSSYLLSPEGEIIANYRKIHLFGYNSRESQILTPGNSVVVAETPLGKFGMATCYDLRFPELFRKMVDQGAEAFLVCSAWPYPRLEHWLLLNRVRAFENQCFLISANSVGPNLDTVLVGHSMVVDPYGVVIAGSGDEEAVIRVDIDLDTVREARDKFPALMDRVDWLNP